MQKCTLDENKQFMENVRNNPDIEKLLKDFSAELGNNTCPSAGGMKGSKKKRRKMKGGAVFTRGRVKTGLFIAGTILAVAVQGHTIYAAHAATCSTGWAIAHMVVRSGYCATQQAEFMRVCEMAAVTWGGIAFASGVNWLTGDPVPDFSAETEAAPMEPTKGGKGLSGSRKKRRGSRTKRLSRSKQQGGSRSRRCSRSRAIRRKSKRKSHRRIRRRPRTYRTRR